MTATRRPQIFVAFRTFVVATAFILLWVGLAVLVRRIDPWFQVPLPSWLRPVGVVMAIAGALLALTCIVAFAIRGRGTPAPFDPPREFVAYGPYRFVRNPMYVGGIAVIAGAGLALSSPAIVLLGMLAFAAFHLFVVFYEEPTLARLFGDNYLRYKASVSRWRIRRPRPNARHAVG